MVAAGSYTFPKFYSDYQIVKMIIFPLIVFSCFTGWLHFAKSYMNLVYLASDEKSFISKASKNLPVPVISFQQQRKVSRRQRISGNKKHEPLFRGHNEKKNTEKGRCALIDSLILSHCNYILKCQSALSGWSKIWNPQLETYRVAAFKRDWFPDAFIPLYKTENSGLNSELILVQEGEISSEVKLKSSRPVSAYLG